MATYQQLQDEVCAWLNRRDILSLIPGWVAMVETEISETLRSRFQVVSGTQPIDAAYISLPPDFATMESIRDATTGEMLHLKDEWSGHWFSATEGGSAYYPTVQTCAPATEYRLVHDCIEFLPHPSVPNPPNPNWVPQSVLMAWYQRPKPLLLPADTNPILDNLYGVYLFGVCKYGAMFELDDDRTAQMDAAWQAVVTRANLWKQQSDYSGAPFRAEMAVTF
jgi:hypothetical protein